MSDEEDNAAGAAHLELIQWTIPTLIDKAKDLSFVKEDRVSLWLILLYASIIELSNSICRLLSGGEPTGSRSLARMVLEAYVDLKNLSADDDYVHNLDVKALSEWQLTYKRAKEGNVYFAPLFDVPGIEESVSEEADRLASLLEKGYRALGAKERFERAGMADAYEGLYHWLCSDTHNSLRGMSLRHIQIDGKGSYGIHILKDSPIGADIHIIDTLLLYLRDTSSLIHARFGNGEAALEELADRYKRVFGEREQQ